MGYLIAMISAEGIRTEYLAVDLAMLLTQAGLSLSSVALVDSSSSSWPAVKILTGFWSAGYELSRNYSFQQSRAMFSLCGHFEFPRMNFPTSKRGSLLHSAILHPPLSLSNLSKIISNGSKLYLQ